MNTYSVYKHTSPSGKVYIGITGQRLEKRWGRGGSGYKNNPYFCAAIEKYGWGAFKHEILAVGLAKEEAERQEIALIERYKSTDKNYGYNIDLGGGTGASHSPETRAKIGEANRRRVWTAEARAKVGAASKGRKQSEETRQKRSASHRGVAHSEEAKAKIRAAKQRPVVCVNTGNYYRSIEDAAASTGINPSLISGVCRGRHRATHGLRWKYAAKEVIA